MSNAFSLVQREIYIKEELSALTKLQSFTQDEKERIDSWLEELKTFDKKYWLHKRAIYENLLDRPNGPWTRLCDLLSNDFSFFQRRENFCAKLMVGAVSMIVDVVNGR